MNITVFGGAQPKEGTSAYEEARELGSLLAQRGHAVLTGGYMGTMEAVSRGAHEAGGHVIGVTCIDIEEWRKTKPNEWVKEERRKQTLMDRLTALVEGCDAAIAPTRRRGHVDRSVADVEFDDRGVFAPEAVGTDRTRLAVHLRSVLRRV
ncbi:MAG: LOG family protein [Anaerolineales bacterium]|nr:LOG family protein [Anaerolineales bacterium]